MKPATDERNASQRPMLTKEDPMTEWMSLSEAGLALRVSANTIRRWIGAEKLPAAKVGRQWRVRAEDVENFVHWVVPPEHVLVLGPDDPEPNRAEWIRLGSSVCDCGDVCRRTGDPK